MHSTPATRAVLPAQHPHGGDEEVHLHALVLGLRDLRLVGGHLRARAPVEEAHLGDAQAQRGARAVDGGVPAAHHQHPAVDVDLALEAELLEELDAGEHPRGVFVRDAHPGAVPGPDSQEDGVVAALLEAGHREVAPELDVGGELDAEIEDLVDLEVEHVLGQTVLGDAVAQHAPRLGLGLEHRDLVAAEGEVVGAGQPRRARPDDRHLLAVRRGHARTPGVLVAQVEVGEVALDVVDADRLVEQGAPAALDLAGPGADAPAHRGQGVASP